jgi:cystathionine gamma-synthase
MKLATKSLHADKASSPDVSAPLHVSTTFRYPQGYNEFKASQRGWLPGDQEQPPNFHIYSRYSQETRTRLEQVLGALEDGFAVTYSSGLTSIFALMLHLQPEVDIFKLRL